MGREGDKGRGGRPGLIHSSVSDLTGNGWTRETMQRRDSNGEAGVRIRVG